MTRRRAALRTALAPIVYWLVLLCAIELVLLFGSERGAGGQSGLRFADACSLIGGSVLGTACGQLLARARVRLWLVAIIIPGVLSVVVYPTVVIVSSAVPDGGNRVAELLLMSCAPAALCGYASMTERGALAAFWYPAALWMIGVLDRSESDAVTGAEAVLLLAALAAFFLVFLYARERRRIALWQTKAAVRVAPARPRAVLLQAPLRSAAQAVWLLATAGATLLLTMWIAPHLWQKDESSERVAAVGGEAAPGTGAGGGAVCCPETSSAEAKSRRVREYLPLLEPKLEQATAASGRACVPCAAGARWAAGTWPGAGSGRASVLDLNLESSPEGAITSKGSGPTAAHYQYRWEDGKPVATETTATLPTAVRPPVAPEPAGSRTPPPAAKIDAVTAPLPAPALTAPKLGEPVAAGAIPTTASAAPSFVPPAARSARGGDGPVVEWLLALVVAAAIVQLALRPLRRMVTLRHLARPLWPEPLDQQVSNHWQWMLVGLRDAGFQATEGEQPGELARRVEAAGVPGVDVGAAALERARHGVRVDPGDVTTTREAARSVYTAARARVGWLSRMASWLRWPLV
jgi:hypothetical protein